MDAGYLGLSCLFFTNSIKAYPIHQYALDSMQYIL